ncbi:GbsR/MarR family transcriptional regulator [Limimaricola litoreus]
MTDLRADFIERLGVLALSEGGSRNAGRLFGLLAFEGRAMTAAEIAGALRISPSSVAQGARFLQSHGMIRRVAHKTRRAGALELAPDVFDALQGWICARRRAVCQEFDDIIAALPESAADTRDRLETHARFHRSIASAIASVEDRTRDR